MELKIEKHFIWISDDDLEITIYTDEEEFENHIYQISKYYSLDPNQLDSITQCVSLDLLK